MTKTTDNVSDELRKVEKEIDKREFEKSLVVRKAPETNR